MNRLDLKKTPAEVYGLLQEIGRHADEHGRPVFLVGGMVRDLMLGHRSKDIDIVIEGNGIEFATELMGKWRAKQAHMTVHKKFGTAAIEFKDGLTLDIVTARRESYARPGVLPDVVPGLIADDLFRRDFTINAVAVSLSSGDFGMIHDNFDGCADIKNKLIRIMHYRSFVDDPTRILRAVRYEKRFDFKFEPRTFSVLKQALEENVFSAISSARYFGEFRRILKEEDPRKALRRLASLNGLRFFVYDNPAESAFKAVLQKGLVAEERWISLFVILIESLDRASAEELLVSFNMPRMVKNKILKRLL